jgi:Asp-tRNA(Asn)/Glu-tRNA(Gln) amidotransferase B subunit
MTLAEKLLKEFETLNENHQTEVIDFVEFLKMREEKRIEKMMDDIITENMEALKELAK